MIGCVYQQSRILSAKARLITKCRQKKFGLGNQESCPARECQITKATKFWRQFPISWEAGIYRLAEL